MLKFIGQLLVGASAGDSSAASSQSNPTEANDQELFRLCGGQLMACIENTNAPAVTLNEALLTIRKTAMPFNYQLVVQAVDSSGSNNVDDELDDEQAFLIDRSINFHRSTAADAVSFFWKDQSSDPVREFEFRMPCKRINTRTIDFFETKMLECMFERTFQKSSDAATVDDLELLKFRPKSMPASSGKTAIAIPSDNKKQHRLNGEEELVTTLNAVDLFLYDSKQLLFVLQAENIGVTLIKVNTSECWIRVSGPDRTYISQPLENRMNPYFSSEHRSFIWVYTDDRDPSLSLCWSIRFKSDSDESMFRKAFSRAMFEIMHGEPFEKAKKEDESYFMEAFAPEIEMNDVQSVSDSDRQLSDDEDDEEEADHENKENTRVTLRQNDADNDKNSQLAIGYKHQRSFVIRGNRIGVFKNDFDNVEYSTSINNIQTPSGQLFSPAKVMLHDQDSSMVLMNPNQPDRLYKLDLERGQVVETWEMGDGRELRDFTHDSKYAQMAPTKTFVGIGHNSVFRVDPRLAGGKLVDSEFKQYSSRLDLSVAATSGTGNLAIASNKGDIRLYNNLGKMAKTHLPGLGDPIIGLDISEDGKFILATCKTYLLVLATEGKTEDGDGFSGFQKSLGANKPIPKRLQLKPEHVCSMQEPVSFTPARFNTGDDMEKTIVCSSGPYVITWNFRRVKSGHLTDYIIKKYPNKVVADNFIYGSDKKVVVALPDDVTMVSRSSMAAPEVEILGAPRTPARELRNRETIVNSPF